MGHNYGRFLETSGTEDTSKAFLDQIRPVDYPRIDMFPPSSPLSFKPLHLSTAADNRRKNIMN